jgi:hypothetical protein
MTLTPEAISVDGLEEHPEIISNAGQKRSCRTNRRTKERSMRSRLIALVCAATAVGYAPPAAAHHSFAAQFDGDKPVVLRGVVTKVDWRNPHIWVYLDVREADGKVTKWECEGGAPNALTRQGWSRDNLKLGEELTVDGWRAKDGTNTCNARTWKLANGQPVLAGSSNANAGAGR